jgi:16S rRNA (uracil1498-N3)-methyltransferase
MQRYFVKEKINDKFILEQSDIHHIKNVMRNKDNDKIEVVYDKKTFICNIDNINDCSLSIVEELEENNELDIELVVVCSLVKEQKMDLILQKLTELGVSKIIPLKTERSIVKLDEKRESKKLIRWQAICKEASEQAKRNNVPVVTDIYTLKDLVKEESDMKLVCSVNEKNNFINNYLQNYENCAKMIVVIGPEGGFSDKEEEFLVSNGYDRVSLGNRVLRVETATIYVASVINFCSMR